MEKTMPNKVLRRKFFHYLLPTLAIMAVIPSGQVLESVILSRVLGSGTMAAVSLASPLMLLASAVYYFIGSGGVGEFTIALNQGDEKKAGIALQMTIMTASACGMLLAALARIFLEPVTRMLCADLEMLPQFQRYFRIVVYAVPLLIFFLTLTGMLIPLGRPLFASGAVFAVTAVHVILTFTFVKYTDMKSEGAALARIAAYLAGSLVTLAGVISYMPHGKPTRDRKKIRSILLGIFRKSNTEGYTVSGMALRFFLTFHISSTTMGADAVRGFSVCTLIILVYSILQGTFIGITMPMIALLHDQEDYASAGRVLKFSIRMQVILSAVWFAFSFAMARPLIIFFGGYKEEQIRMGVSILRIYSFTYLFRGGYLLFRNYLKILNLRSYEIKLTIAVIITNGIYLLCTMLGGAALWWANPVSSMLLLIFTFVMNRRMVRASGGQLHGLLLIPREQKALQTINASLGLSRNEIARFGHKFQTMCEQNGIEPRNAAISAFAVEELLLNVLEARKRKDYADISARIYPDRMVIDFRTLGPAFQAEEMKLLQKISQTITHRTVAGMNCTRLELARRAPMPAESPVLPKAALKTE